MYTPFKVNDVIQFTEQHKWGGVFGIISEINNYDDDIRYMIGCPTFTQNGEIGTAYIFEWESERRFEYVGKAILVPDFTEENDYE